ncbi:MAG: hypothetical protein ACI8TX_003757 [Hyphomicrobiaceae bacterium]|jgi:hypothetical protein
MTKIVTGALIALTVSLTVGLSTPTAHAASFCGKADSMVLISDSSGKRFVLRALTGDIAGCTTGMAFGKATHCTRASMGTIAAFRFSVRGPTASAPFGTGDFCTWACGGGGSPCVVKANLVDGLPVELLSFGVE